MENNFKEALELVLKHEGGWANHPSDPGGSTMKGVTFRVFKSFFGEDSTLEDLRNISTTQLEHVYKTGYWDKCKCDKLPNGVDYVVFDAAVNSGPRQASKWLQRVVGTNDDGIIGPNTLNGIREYNKPLLDLIYNLCYKRLRFMQGLNIWEKFSKGWSARVLEVQFMGAKIYDRKK